MSLRRVGSGDDNNDDDNNDDGSECVLDAESALAAASARLQTLAAARVRLAELDVRRAAVIVELAMLERQVRGDEQALVMLQARAGLATTTTTTTTTTTRDTLAGYIEQQRVMQRDIARFVETMVANTRSTPPSP